MLRQPPPHGARLLRPQVERQILLVPIEKPQLGALVDVDDREDLGDGFAEVMAVSRAGALLAFVIELGLAGEGFGSGAGGRRSVHLGEL